MRACVIFNPTAQGDKARRFRKFLESIRAEAGLKSTTGPGSARALASEAVAEGFEIIVAAGGDGTVNETLNGIGDVPNGLERCSLGVLPLGTVNVFARDLGIPLKLAGAWETIRRARKSQIDLPEVVCAPKDALVGNPGAAVGPVVKRYFAQMAGAGLDACAVNLVNWEIKKRFGQFAYIVAACQAFAGPQPLLRIRTDDQTFDVEFAVIGNGRFYAGSFTFFHRADFRDGLLDLYLFPKLQWHLLPRYGLAYFLGRVNLPGGAIYAQSRTIELSTASQAYIQLDGEVVGQAPARFSMKPRALSVIIP